MLEKFENFGWSLIFSFLNFKIYWLLSTRQCNLFFLKLFKFLEMAENSAYFFKFAKISICVCLLFSVKPPCSLSRLGRQYNSYQTSSVSK